MDRDDLERWLAEGRSLDWIGHQVGRHPSTIGYWVRKLGLEAAWRARHAPRGAPDPEVLSELVARGMTIAEIAAALDRSPTTVRHWLGVHGQRILVAEAGGACVLCGYDRRVAALHLHHLDPSTKRFNLGLKGMARAIDNVREEARKCVLLCANCHAEVEAGVAELRGT